MHLVDDEEMDDFVCFQISTSYFPQKLIEVWNLLDYVDAKGMAFWEVIKVMHGLPQSGSLSNKVLVKCMDKLINIINKTSVTLMCYSQHKTVFT